ETKFVPETWDKTYFQWLDNIQPWCISRQLWWGHQIPVWWGPDLPTGGYLEDDAHVRGLRPFCAGSEAEAIALAKAHYGPNVDVRVDVSGLRGVGSYGIDAAVQGGAGQVTNVTLNRDPDVLDTWFSSALWPFSTLGWPEETPELKRYYKTDVLVTGFDIIFFWVARMMMMGLHVMRDEDGKPEVPFHTVYINSIVRDEHGKKMSKSLGNIIDPLELIDEYGADAVRFTLTSMAAMGRDIPLATDRIKGYRNFGTKLWNAARFCEMNECRPVADFDPASPTRPVNRWIVGETVRMVAAVDEALEAYRFNDAAAALYDHIWKTFCDWYVELAKPLLQGDDGAAKTETRATAAWALDRIIVALHPIMPFITEELWAEIGTQIGGRATMCVHADWPVLDSGLIDPAAEEEIGWMIKLIEGVRSVRAEMNVPAGAQIELLMTGHSPATAMRLLRNADLIQRLARLKEVAVAEEAPAGCVTFAMEDCAINLPLAGVIDVAAETGRLDREIGKLDKEMGGLSAKLSNEKFLAKAPEAVVAEQRDRLATAEAERTRLMAAKERLDKLS
ncbi:MAG: class I tRNA ligase family protein, partial [Pseudomonadota bacterium]